MFWRGEVFVFIFGDIVVLLIGKYGGRDGSFGLMRIFIVFLFVDGINEWELLNSGFYWLKCSIKFFFFFF